LSSNLLHIMHRKLVIETHRTRAGADSIESFEIF
jgi:hypothetical protein